jgi:Xaa-Pro aminopeptidase
MIDLRTLPVMNVAARADRLRALLDEGENACDALLVTKLVNVRYLTGFTGSAGMLLVSRDQLLLITDGRYRDQAAEQLAAAGVEAQLRIGLTMAGQYEILGTAATGLRLGLEAHAVSWADQRAMASTHLPVVK